MSNSKSTSTRTAPSEAAAAEDRSVFAALDANLREQAGVLDRDLPPEKRSGIRCETLDWYCAELEHAGFRILEAKREASVEAGWGGIVVAEKGRAGMACST